MATDRGRQIVLGLLLVVLAVVMYRAWSTGSFGTSSAPTSSSNTRARASRTADGAESTATAPDVQLQALEGERPKPEASDRNLFRFGQREAPSPPPGAALPPPPVRPVGPGGPPGPAQPPPIPLRFIGIVESPMDSKRIAALVDAMGNTYHGIEGEIVAGQYRVLKIGVESIEMSYLDGRGRQTIRLSGS
jgi:hypothetical protein